MVAPDVGEVEKGRVDAWLALGQEAGGVCERGVGTTLAHTIRGTHCHAGRGKQATGIAS